MLQAVLLLMCCNVLFWPFWTVSFVAIAPFCDVGLLCVRYCLHGCARFAALVPFVSCNTCTAPVHLLYTYAVLGPPRFESMAHVRPEVLNFSLYM